MYNAGTEALFSLNKAKALYYFDVCLDGGIFIPDNGCFKLSLLVSGKVMANPIDFARFVKDVTVFHIHCSLFCNAFRDKHRQLEKAKD